MRAVLVAIVASVASIAAGAAPASTPKLGYQAQSQMLHVGESRSLQIMGATAAWAIDPAVADVAVQNGSVLVFARGVGRTKIVAIALAGEMTIDVVVESKRGTAKTGGKPPADRGAAQVRYSSAEPAIYNDVTVRRGDDNRGSEVRVQTVHRTAQRPGGPPATTLPSASYRIFTPDREITFLDRAVDYSPLTLTSTAVRGIHYRDRHWRLTAGATAYATHQSFLLPVDRELVIGGGYTIQTGPRSTVTPGVFVYPGNGTVASVLYETDPSDALSVRGELGVSRAVGAALQIGWDTDRDQAYLDARFRPEGLPMAGPELHGLRADGAWSHAYGRGSTAALTFSASDYSEIDQRTASASLDVDHRLSEVLALTGGASWGLFDTTRSLTIPAGVRIDYPRFGVAALYRYATNSATNRGGHGGRVSGRVSLGRLHANAFYDRQQNAPTLGLIYSEQPELALALEELGIRATTAADVARALRDNADLIALGFIEGVTVDLAPVRTQAAFELAWMGRGRARNQVRLRVLRNVTEGVTSRTETLIGTLSYARRLTAATDVFGSYSYHRAQQRGRDAIEQPFVEAGVRHTFDRLPSVFSRGGSIAGVVFVDEDLDGVSDGRGVAQALVELDGMRSVRSRADGSFAFADVPAGSHRIVVRIVDRPDAYFTTPSQVEAQPGDEIAFGVAYSPARLLGKVLSDAGEGIPNVRILLVRGPNQVVATTESSGEFSINAAPGDWDVSILTDSVPAGYSFTGSEARPVHLDRAVPVRVDFTLRANRTVTGSATPGSIVRVEPLGRTVTVDESGQFAIRGLPPGSYTVVIGTGRYPASVSSGPASVRVETVAQASTAPAVAQPPDEENGYIVQLGAYRVPGNALTTAEAARRAGVAPLLVESGRYTIVRIGPFDTRAAAAEAASRMHRAGLEAVVIRVR